MVQCGTLTYSSEGLLVRFPTLELIHRLGFFNIEISTGIL